MPRSPRSTSHTFDFERQLFSRAHRRPAGVGHIRPRDLLAKRPPAREPTAPAERFAAALLGDETLGLDVLEGVERLENITIKLVIEEVAGAVEGDFQDATTYCLLMKLEPIMFMTPFKVELDKYKGGEHAEDAPTWLALLRDVPSHTGHAFRTYRWLELFVIRLLTTPGLLPRARMWAEIFEYTWRIKEVCNMRTRVLPSPSRPRPRPRPRRSAIQLVAAMEALSLEHKDGIAAGGIIGVTDMLGGHEQDRRAVNP
ncbi:hypothetical protein C2E23DRAFT_754535 [Lenzites betulinus]|nr:hypothetical protein C2E23DRAFT_754535 [Lenzites betulinus]